MQQPRLFDVLVIGSGIAGLSTAIACAEKGLHVCVVSKADELHESNTFYAQGGIVESGRDDSPELLSRDIITAGCGINHKEAVQLLAQEGPKTVSSYLVEKVKIPFLKSADGGFDRTKEGAHSVRRILHVKDATGKAVEEGLLQYAAGFKTLRFLSNHTAVDIITNSHNSRDPQERYRSTRTIGSYILNEEDGSIYAFFAPHVILAAGGAGNLFLHTSNPIGACGDGIAMAYRAGAQVINMEYIQFHPTILYHRDKKRFLISEALRGEGAKLCNHRGEYFMDKYNPELKELAPRDEVARAIFREMDAEGSSYVLLDARSCRVSPKERFPGIYRQCLSLGIDIEKEPIPVVPAAHYCCGGIKVDTEGRTSLEGLYAVGENSCTGVHGANRLASVSLLEALFFGIRTGEMIADNRSDLNAALLESIPGWVYPREEEEAETILIHHDMKNIQSTMWNYVGIIRSRKRLLRALSDLNYYSHRIHRFYDQARVSRYLIELRNAVLVATIIARAGVSNPTSLGCHFIE
jgi:L-aspartate oxidase